MKNNNKKFYNLILIILLIITFVKTYSNHSNNPYPIHHDEWQHIAFSKQAEDYEYNAKINPYTGENKWQSDLEPGFHLFLSAFERITQLDLILFYKYFAAIFATLTALIIYFVIKNMTKSKLTAILSLIFFISLKTNVNILGKSFFIPMTMAYPFMFLHIYYLNKGLYENNFKSFILSLIFIIFIFFIHPPSSVILLIPTLILMIINKNFFIKLRKKEKISLGFIVLFGIIFTIILIWRGTISNTLEYIIHQIYFEKGWGKLEITYFIPLVYGIINTLLALYGMKKEYNSNLKYFTYLGFLTLGITAIFNLKHFSLIIPYQRAIHYVLISLIPLSAVGVTHLLKNKKFKSKTVILIILFIAFFISNMNSYSLFDKYLKYDYSIINDDDYTAFQWLNENKGDNNLLMTPYIMTSAVYPLSKNRVVSIIPSQFNGGNITLNQMFYSSYNCNEKINTIKENNINFIYSRLPISCDSLNNIYSGTTSYFYELEVDND